MKKTVCELFAGVGGFRLGLEKSGDWEVIYANQWEPSRKSQDAFDCYTSHFDEGEHVNKDIAEVEADSIPGHNLLVGGFPCQDYSVARTNAEGIVGKKGVLWWEIDRILTEKRPPFVLLENVNRLLRSPSSQRGRDFGVMLGCLRDLGYAVEWREINAADYGFPQKRRRVFIFAFHKETKLYNRLINTIDDYNNEVWIHKNGFFQEEFSIKDKVYKANTRTLRGNIKNISDNFQFNFEKAGVMFKGDIYTEKVEAEKISSTILSQILEKNVIDDYYYLNDNELDKWKYMKGAKKEKRVSKDGHEYYYSEGAVPFPDSIDRPARTILTSERNKNRSTHIIRDPEKDKLRILTPLEVERLNGFDDNWTDTGMSRPFRYFCMGNALVVGLIEKMGKSLDLIFEIERDSNIENNLHEEYKIG